MEWKEEGKECKCGMIESERHVLLECKLYERERKGWMDAWRKEMGNASAWDGLRGYVKIKEKLESMTVICMGIIWKERERVEEERKVRE